MVPGSAVLRACSAVGQEHGKSVESDHLARALTQFKDKGSRGPVAPDGDVRMLDPGGFNNEMYASSLRPKGSV